jgi:hypothetical protein
MVDEITTEIQYPNPNGIRLQGLLMGLAVAAHLAGDDTELEDAVKIALAFLRIDVF